MDPSLFGVLAAIMKLDYGANAIVEAINYESSLLDATTPSAHKYHGTGLIIPIHIDMNMSSEAVGPGGESPVPDTEAYCQINITIGTLQSAAKFIHQQNVLSENGGDYGPGDLAKKATDGLIKAHALYKDTLLYTGQRSKLVFNTHDTGTATTTGGYIAGTEAGAGLLTLQAAGDLGFFHLCDPANDATWVPVLLTRNENQFNGPRAVPGLAFGYQYASTANGMFVNANNHPDADILCFVAGVNVANGTVTIAVIDNDAAAGVVELDTTAITAGFGGSIEINPIQAKDSTGAANVGINAMPQNVNTGVGIKSWYEPQGMIANLCSPIHFGTPRSSGNSGPVRADNTRIQSFVMTEATAGAHARTTLTLPRLNDAITLNQLLVGTETFDRWICSIFQRTRYLSLFTATTITNFGDRKTVDASPSTQVMADTKKKPWLQEAFTIAGFPVGLTQSCPNGLFFGWKKDAFKLIQADAGHWMPGTVEGMFNYVAGPNGRPTTNLFAWWLEMYMTYSDNPATMFIFTGMSL